MPMDMHTSLPLFHLYILYVMYYIYIYLLFHLYLYVFLFKLHFNNIIIIIK